MGNTQSGLTGIHPFKDAESSAPTKFIPPAPIANLTLPEYTLPQPIPSSVSNVPEPPPISVTAPPTWTEVTVNPEPEKFEQLFTVRAPTPPPRRVSYNEASKPNRRVPKQSFLHRGFTSLRTLPRMISRPDLAKLRSLFRRKRVVVGELYPVPPDAEKPSSPSKPDVIHEQDEFFLLRWDPPAYDGGLPIIGYVIQHLELGLPSVDGQDKDDTQCWFSSEPGAVTSTEVLLNNLIPGTTYQFRVIAENLLGYSPPSDISAPIVFNPNGELDDWFCPPTLIVPLNDNYVVIEHERLVLSVEVTGQPYPIVKWYGRSGEELGKHVDPTKYSTVSTGYKRVLTINAVDVGDSGAIRCVCENERGVVECGATVVVEAPPRIRRLFKPDTLTRTGEKPDEGNLIFRSGELAVIKFNYSGSPSPNVCVYHEADLVDGEEVPGSSGRIYHQRVHTERSDNILTVKISGVKRTDRGEWTVRLDNVLGEDAASVLVTITDRPSEPGRPDVLQLSDNTVILKWDAPDDDGGCPVSAYTVEYFRSEWGVWLKACTTKNPYTKIRDLIPGSKYRFRVKSENLYGMSGASEESVELLITDVTSTLRSVAGDSEGALMMGTVLEEDEDPVPLEQSSPGSRSSLHRVSAATNTDISMGGVDTKPPAPGAGESETAIETPPPAAAPHPNPQATPFLSISLQPKVVIQEEDYFDEDEEDEDPLEHSPFNMSPARTRSPSPNIQLQLETSMRSTSPLPSPVAPPRKTFTQMFDDSFSLTLNRSQDNLPTPPQRHVRAPSPNSSLQQHPMSPNTISPPQNLSHRASSPNTITPPQRQAKQRSPRPEVQISAPIPVVIPIDTSPKKLYSRAEIIKSAAPMDFSSSYFPDPEDSTLPDHEEPEEDPELLKVKEALSKDDFEIDDDEEDEYEVDFDRLQQEYEEDKRKGVISRQDSGVSAAAVSRTTSIEEEDEDHRRPTSSMSEAYVPRTRMFKHPSFERAQSEVVQRITSSPIRVIEIDTPEGIVPPPVEPRRPPSRSGSNASGVGGSRTMLHDRFTDYLAMKASSRNKQVGSSMRSLSGSRQSSTENVSRDSGRSSMQATGSSASSQGNNNTNFVVRRFDPRFESEAVRRLERSVSVGAKSLSIFAVVSPQNTLQDSQSRTGSEVQHQTTRETENQSYYPPSTPQFNYSSPEISCLRPQVQDPRPKYCSETQVHGVHIPDSGLRDKVAGPHHNIGGVDPEEGSLEESYGSGGQDRSGEGQEGQGAGEEAENHGSGGSLDRELPRDRVFERLRKKVSFGSSNDVFENYDQENEEGEEGEVNEEDRGGESNETSGVEVGMDELIGGESGETWKEKEAYGMQVSGGLDRKWSGVEFDLNVGHEFEDQEEQHVLEVEDEAQDEPEVKVEEEQLEVVQEIIYGEDKEFEGELVSEETGGLLEHNVESEENQEICGEDQLIIDQDQCNENDELEEDKNVESPDLEQNVNPSEEAGEDDNRAQTEYPEDQHNEEEEEEEEVIEEQMDADAEEDCEEEEEEYEHDPDYAEEDNREYEEGEYDDEYYARVYECVGSDNEEVFEMDVDGIDPRTYEGYETGEEDSGVMYVLLEHPSAETGGLKLTDISAFAPEESSGRSERLENLLVKLDQFLEEEEENEVEEIEDQVVDEGGEEVGEPLEDEVQLVEELSDELQVLEAEGPAELLQDKKPEVIDKREEEVGDEVEVCTDPEANEILKLEDVHEHVEPEAIQSQDPEDAVAFQDEAQESKTEHEDDIHFDGTEGEAQEKDLSGEPEVIEEQNLEDVHKDVKTEVIRAKDPEYARVFEEEEQQTKDEVPASLAKHDDDIHCDWTQVESPPQDHSGEPEVIEDQKLEDVHEDIKHDVTEAQVPESEDDALALEEEVEKSEEESVNKEEPEDPTKDDIHCDGAQVEAHVQDITSTKASSSDTVEAYKEPPQDVENIAESPVQKTAETNIEVMCLDVIETEAIKTGDHSEFEKQQVSENENLVLHELGLEEPPQQNFQVQPKQDSETLDLEQQSPIQETDALTMTETNEQVIHPSTDIFEPALLTTSGSQNLEIKTVTREVIETKPESQATDAGPTIAQPEVCIPQSSDTYLVPDPEDAPLYEYEYTHVVEAKFILDSSKNRVPSPLLFDLSSPNRRHDPEASSNTAQSVTPADDLAQESRPSPPAQLQDPVSEPSRQRVPSPRPLVQEPPTERRIQPPKSTSLHPPETKTLALVTSTEPPKPRLPSPRPLDPHVSVIDSLKTDTQSPETTKQTTFSYKQYIADHPPRPPPPTNVPPPPPVSAPRSLSSTRILDPVREEPSSPTPPIPPPYRPNLNAYARTRSTTPVAKPQTQKLIEPADDSTPVSIDEIRAILLGSGNITDLVAAPDPEPEVIIVKKPPPDPPATVSPFMSYLFNAAFYLMLSPMVLFIDSLYLGLFCLLLVACVHFFLIR